MSNTKTTEFSLGKRIKDLRISSSLTQEQVASSLDVTPGYVSNVENGRTAMSLRMLIYYARLTGVTLDYLVGNVDDSYHSTSLDNEILLLTQNLNDTEKQKLIDTIKIWK